MTISEGRLEEIVAERLAEQIDQSIAAERERCAKIAENHGTCEGEDCGHRTCNTARKIAAKIRSGE